MGGGDGGSEVEVHLQLHTVEASLDYLGNSTVSSQSHLGVLDLFLFPFLFVALVVLESLCTPDWS